MTLQCELSPIQKADLLETLEIYNNFSGENLSLEAYINQIMFDAINREKKIANTVTTILGGKPRPKAKTFPKLKLVG